MLSCFQYPCSFEHNTVVMGILINNKGTYLARIYFIAQEWWENHCGLYIYNSVLGVQNVH